jgi:Transcriptional regulatory protein, C terminal
VHLTPTEYELLRTLMRNGGRLMTHRALLTEVWGTAYEHDTQVLRVHLANLRHKIEPTPSSPRHIVPRTQASVTASRTRTATEPLGTGLRFRVRVSHKRRFSARVQAETGFMPQNFLRCDRDQSLPPICVIGWMRITSPGS